MSLINKYNMIVWDDDGSPSTSCVNEYTYPIIEGDTIGFYINFYTPLTEDASGWQIGWWTSGAIILGNIAALSEDVIDGANRNLYGEVTVGVLPRTLLRLVIYDPSDSNAIKYWSKGFRYKTSSANTSVFKYRNYRNVLNYEFENVTAFYNQVRIDVRIGEPIAANDTEGYEVTTGHKVRSKTIHRVSREFETQFFDEQAHQGFNAATEMSHFYFDNERYERDTGAQYTQETVSKEYSFWLGRLRLEQYDFTAVASNT